MVTVVVTPRISTESVNWCQSVPNLQCVGDLTRQTNKCFMQYSLYFVPPGNCVGGHSSPWSDRS